MSYRSHKESGSIEEVVLESSKDVRNKPLIQFNRHVTQIKNLQESNMFKEFKVKDECLKFMFTHDQLRGSDSLKSFIVI